MKSKTTFFIVSIFIISISIIFTLLTEFKYYKFVDSWFIVSGLATAIFLFKYIIDRGAFDLFRYNWYKTKKIALFFLPRNWKTKNESFEEEKEVNFNNFDEFQEYRIKTSWQNIDILLLTSIFHLIISIILSLALL